MILSYMWDPLYMMHYINYILYNICYKLCCAYYTINIYIYTYRHIYIYIYMYMYMYIYIYIYIYIYKERECSVLHLHIFVNSPGPRRSGQRFLYGVPRFPTS